MNPGVHLVRAAASTLPAVLLGGEVPDDPESAYAGWRKALRLPNVKGLVARPGRLGQLVVLGGDPRGEHGVDGPVVGLPPGQQHRVVELLVG